MLGGMGGMGGAFFSSGGSSATNPAAPVVATGDAGVASESARLFEVYDLGEMTGQTAIALLRLAVPDAQVSLGDKPNQLIVSARPQEHELVSKSLREIQAGVGIDQ